MGQFFNSIKDVSKNYSKYDQWEQDQADITAKKEWLAQNIEIAPDRFVKTEQRAQAAIRAAEIMDARSEDNCENMEQVMGFAATIPAIGIPTLQILGEPVIMKKTEAHYNKKIKSLIDKINELSRECKPTKELENSLEQLKNKKLNTIKKIPNFIHFGGLGLLLLTTIGLIFYGNSKQKEASRIGRYQAKQDELKGVENFAIYTPEQIAEAEEIAKNIPDKKERKGIAKAFQELKAMSKAKSGYKKSIAEKDPQEIEKLKSREISPEELENAKEQKELITKVVKDVNIKAEEYSENLENTFDTLGTISWIAALPIGLGVKKLLSKFTKLTPTKSNIISTLVGTATGLTISILGTFEQKNASRVGRYHARQDLLEHPEKLMNFSDKEMELAKEVKADNQKIGLFKKIGKSFAFLKDYYKHKKEYKQYKETTQKENEKLQEAFKQIKITEKQKQDAKTLQSNVFRAFDEVDEMSQRYSEDVEAGTEAAKQIASTAWSFGTAIAVTGLTIGIIRGKVNLVKPVNGLVNMTLKKESTLRKAVNKLAEALSKQGKKARVDFQKNLLKGNLNTHLKDTNNTVVKEAVEEVAQEFGNIATKGFTKIGDQDNKLGTILNKLFEDHFKDGWFAKWTRGLTADCTKLWANNKFGESIPKEAKEAFGLNMNWENYKSLWKTLIVGGIPIFGTIFAVPYMFNAWLTDIQKKAGKIGVMKALERLDDPKIFAKETQP